MTHGITSELQSRLDTTPSKLANWRQKNVAPRPFPAESWSTAVELGQQLGPARVARELKLDYGTPKRRAKQQTVQSLSISHPPAP